MLNDFLVGTGAGAYIKKTIAEVKSLLGISNVNNTSDANKPVSTAQQAALNLKLDKSLFTAVDDFIVGGGAGVAVKKSKSEVVGLLGSVPPGTVVYIAGTTIPSGWIKANGALLSRITYSTLFGVIGTTFGAGDGSTTFALPDLRGEFLRGFDDGRGGIDAGRVLGSFQGDAFQGHTHRVTYNASVSGSNVQWSGSVSGFADGGLSMALVARYAETDGTNGVPRIAHETRPRNVALLAIIKY